MSGKRDYLNGTRYSLKQEKNWYHFNSDTELLGRFLEVHDEEKVLDIGCNQGALLYYAKEKADIIGLGVDVFEEVLESARENACYNQVDFTFVCSKIQDYRGELVDVIVCNPPYFVSDLKNDNPYLDVARRQAHLPSKDLMESVHRLLKGNGRFYVVQKAEKVGTMIEEAYVQGLSCVRLGFAYAHRYSKAKSVLMEFKWGKNTDCLVEEAIFLEER
ncbi:methyltransferase [Bulleidia sp. zg-1006]|uniref:methyltransferase n=1 Tax=Bulleidia sp. zg-1006 TaxID=2806552 RepID=UPI001939EC57|nr:methyltransferase [Bulleidia sp. zg-1006]QRG87450.1 methyltransferase [Bulleidia sp. zg-1006]